MLARLFIASAILGMCFAVPSSKAVAEEGTGQVEGREKHDADAPPMKKRAERRERPDVIGRRGMGMGGPGMGMGGPGMGMGGGPGMGMGGPEAGRRGRGGGMGMAGPEMPGMGMMPGFGMGDPMQRSDPEMYKLLARDRELERESISLSEQYRRAPEEARAELKKQIGEVIGQHFEVRQQRRQLELKRLEADLDRLQAAIKRRQESREDIIKRRVMQLTWEKDHLDF